MVDKYHMSGHKLSWHEDKLKEWYEEGRISPIHIELGTTTACDLNCLGCYGTEIGRTLRGKPYHMPNDTAINLFRDAKEAGVGSITLIGEGENMVRPGFYELLDFSRSIGMDLGIATNTVSLREEKVEDFLRSFVWVRNSIWAASREKYLEIHKKDKFDQVIRNIGRQAEIKNKKGLETTIGMQMVVRNDNIDHIVPLAKLGRELGVDYFVAKPSADTPDKKFGIEYDELRDQEEIFLEAESHSIGEYEVVVKRDKFNCGETHPFKVCHGTEFAIAIDAHGNVAPCGHFLGYRKEDFNMGNINDIPFREILNSKKYWDVQAEIKTLNLDEECETNCMHYHMDQFLEDLKEGIIKLEKPDGPPPPHINFP